MCFDITLKIVELFKTTKETAHLFKKYNTSDIYDVINKHINICNYSGLSPHYNPPALILNNNQIDIWNPFKNDKYDINYVGDYYWFAVFDKKLLNENLSDTIDIEFLMPDNNKPVQWSAYLKEGHRTI